MPEPDASPEAAPAIEATPAPAGPPCRHLRNQGMYVFTDASEAGEPSDYDATAFWCLRTMTGFGPDDEPVGRRDCRDPERSCYEPT